MKLLKIHYLIYLTCCLIFSQNANAQTELPKDALPGKCYERCMIPEEYADVPQQVLVKEASTRIETLPAVYDTIEEQLLVKEGFVAYNVIPPTYTTTTEQIMINEPYNVIEYTPVVFETTQELVMIAPRSVKLVQKKSNSCLSVDPDNCIVWCLEEEGPIIDTIVSQVVKVPMLPKEKTIPAVYKTLDITLVKDPAKLIRLEYAPEYRTYKKLVMVKPASEKVVQVPAEYTSVITRKLVKPARFGPWMETNCLAKN